MKNEECRMQNAELPERQKEIYQIVNCKKVAPKFPSILEGWQLSVSETDGVVKHGVGAYPCGRPTANTKNHPLPLQRRGITHDQRE